ncbi:MAG TPA: DNA primase [Micropepsaceae bacterium]|nr:DNA primase [Micropepsaceae bacterium]
MALPDSFIEEVRARTRIVEVVGARVKLSRRGRQHWGLCPFHNEKTPSFSVSEERGFYHCFGCAAHGDAFRFLMNTEGLSFRESVVRLAERAGLRVPDETPEDRAREEERKTSLDVLEEACAFFEARLKEKDAGPARAYLRSRGLNAETVSAFRIGYAPDSRIALKAHLAAKGISQAQMAEAGLLTRPEEGEPGDLFRNRITFAIRDQRGKVVGFGARTLLPDGKPKYLNSPDSAVFHKGQTLFNIDKARKAAFERQAVIVVEGYLDVIALAQAGIAHAVAPLGTALTEEQLILLWKMAPEPFVCLDGDAAGQKAAARAMERAIPMLRAGQSLRFVMMPEGVDPDDLVRKQGIGAMQKALDGAKPLIDMLWETQVSGADISTPERRAALEGKLLSLVSGIGDETVREHYRRELKDRLFGLFRPSRPAAGAREGRASPSSQRRSSHGWGGASTRTGNGRERFGRFEPEPPNPASLKSSSLAQRARALENGRKSAEIPARASLLLAILVRHPWLLDRHYEEVEQLSFAEGPAEQLRHELLAMAASRAASGEALDTAAVQDHLARLGFALDKPPLTATPLSVFPFLAENAEPGLAEEGWRETLLLHRRVTVLEEELRAARQAFAANANEDTEARLRLAERELERMSEEDRAKHAQDGIVF